MVNGIECPVCADNDREFSVESEGSKNKRKKSVLLKCLRCGAEIDMEVDKKTERVSFASVIPAISNDDKNDSDGGLEVVGLGDPSKSCGL